MSQLQQAVKSAEARAAKEEVARQELEKKCAADQQKVRDAGLRFGFSLSGMLCCEVVTWLILAWHGCEESFPASCSRMTSSLTSANDGSNVPPTQALELVPYYYLGLRVRRPDPTELLETDPNGALRYLERCGFVRFGSWRS